MTKHNRRARKIWSKEGASAGERELPLTHFPRASKRSEKPSYWKARHDEKPCANINSATR